MSLVQTTFYCAAVWTTWALQAGAVGRNLHRKWIPSVPSSHSCSTWKDPATAPWDGRELIKTLTGEDLGNSSHYRRIAFGGSQLHPLSVWGTWRCRVSQLTWGRAHPGSTWPGIPSGKLRVREEEGDWNRGKRTFSKVLYFLKYIFIYIFFRIFSTFFESC